MSGTFTGPHRTRAELEALDKGHDYNGEMLGRLERWIKQLGEPTGAGRANPDNDIIYLLRDCRAALSAERARVIEMCAKAGERYLRKLRGFEVDYSMEEGCGAALRALGQQDTTGDQP